MTRWLRCALLLAVLVGGVIGCSGRSTEPEEIARPLPTNRFPKK